jgi:hypothetical protein
MLENIYRTLRKTGSFQQANAECELYSGSSAAKNFRISAPFLG